MCLKNPKEPCTVMSFLWSLGFHFNLISSLQVKLCDNIPGTDALFLVHNDELMFYQLSWCCEEIPHFILVVWQMLANFNFWNFNFGTDSMLVTLLEKKQTNQLRDHTFLWNAKLNSNYPMDSPVIILDQFINLSHVKLYDSMKLIGCCHKSST